MHTVTFLRLLICRCTISLLSFVSYPSLFFFSFLLSGVTSRSRSLSSLCLFTSSLSYLGLADQQTRNLGITIWITTRQSNWNNLSSTYITQWWRLWNAIAKIREPESYTGLVRPKKNTGIATSKVSMIWHFLWVRCTRIVTLFVDGESQCHTCWAWTSQLVLPEINLNSNLDRCGGCRIDILPNPL